MPTKQKTGPPLNTFIVRFWREPGASTLCWRGQVQHVQSGKRVAFADEGTLLHFLRRWVEMDELSREERDARLARGRTDRCNDR
jgi:hypothetical protein